GATTAHAAGVAFTDRGAERLVVTASAYRLTFSKKNGKILDLVDRASGTHLLRQTTRCLWGAISYRDISYIGGCSFASRGARRFSYRWSPAAATLTLDYSARSLGSVVVTLHARGAFFDLHMTIENRGSVRTRLRFLHGKAPAPCSDRSFCIVHEFETWITRGKTWETPVVRVRIGQTAEQSILAYRHDNGIDAYPSLASKLGDRLKTLAQAPLIK